MKRKLYISVILCLLISAFVIAGCSEKSNVNLTTPEGTLSKYVKDFNSGDGDDVYSLLSSQTKASKSESNIFNKVKALHDGGIRIDDIVIVEKDIQGNTANMNLDVNLLVLGYKKTKNKDTVFILENGEWKMTELLA